TQGGGGANHLYFQSDGWRGRGLDQALQRLMERYQREEQEEEQRAEEEEEDDQGPPGDFQGLAPPDYDETAGGLKMGRPPPAAWWGLLEPQMAQALLDRMEPQLAQTLLERTRPQQAGRVPSGPIRGDQDSMRRLVARLLSSIGPTGLRVRRDLSIKVEPVSSGHRRAEPVSSAHRRSRRSLDVTPPSPSNNPPLLRVKRLEEEEPHPPAVGLQRMKREEELHHGSRRRRRRTANYDSQILINQILEYMRE
ncbi:proprotein convertase subtilisin/kexin type 1 inhibitor, like, partial [Anarhichas minor]|uniref:proprotein convertase subtilisin/kexin type 1 inhibitor, like n=1 Tax=Anarhichas minor TaxID=65739 RepID=UPI003F73CE6F